MNKVELVGRLTRDPEVRYTQTNNTLVATFSLAIRRRFVREGDTQTADFINCVAWSKTGEFVSKYFKKGQMMEVVGRIQTRSYDDSNGQKRYITEVIAEEVGFVGAKGDNPAGGEDFSDMPEDMGAGDTTDFEVSSGDDLPF